MAVQGEFLKISPRFNDVPLTGEAVVESAPSIIQGLWVVWGHLQLLLRRKDWDRLSRYWFSVVPFCRQLPPGDSLLSCELLAFEALHTKVPGYDLHAESRELNAVEQDLSRLADFARQAIDDPAGAEGQQLLGQLRVMAEAVLSNPLPDPGVQPERSRQLFYAWRSERLLPLRSEVAAGLADACRRSNFLGHAHELCLETLNFCHSALKEEGLADFRDPKVRVRWTVFRPGLGPAIWRLMTAAAAVEIELNEFEDAGRLLRNSVHVPGVDLEQAVESMRQYGNLLLQTGKRREAGVHYRHMEEFSRINGTADGELIAELGLLRANPAGPTPIETDLLAARSLLARAESNLPVWGATTMTRLKRGVYEDSARYLVDLLSTAGGRVAECEEFARVTQALRFPTSKVQAGLVDQFNTPAMRLMSGLLVANDHLRQLGSACLLLLQEGFETTGILTLETRNGLLENCCRLDASSGLGPALSRLASAREAEVEMRLTTGGSEVGPASPDLLSAASDAWMQLPDATRNVLSAADHVVIIDDPQQASPWELLHDGDTWLSLKHIIVRFPSLDILKQEMAPNRNPIRNSGQAAVVVAMEDPTLARLPQAQSEAAVLVQRIGPALGCQLLTVPPKTDDVLQALDAGLAFLHYIGHGSAAGIAEGLRLGPRQRIKTSDVDLLSGTGTGFVYLSCCDVGKAVYAGGGLQVGLANSLISRGAGAVVACLGVLPDSTGVQMSREFYRAARYMPAAKALREARRQLAEAKVTPSFWGAFACCGDPSIQIWPPSATVTLRRSRREKWNAYLGEYLVTRSRQAYEQSLKLLAALCDHESRETRDAYRYAYWWLEQCWDGLSVPTEAPTAKYAALLESDPSGFAALECLFCAGRVEAAFTLLNRGIVGVEESVREVMSYVGKGINTASGVQDPLLFTNFAYYIATMTKDIDDWSEMERHVLREAHSYVQAWNAADNSFSSALAVIEAVVGKK